MQLLCNFCSSLLCGSGSSCCPLLLLLSSLGFIFLGLSLDNFFIHPNFKGRPCSSISSLCSLYSTNFVHLCLSFSILTCQFLQRLSHKLAIQLLFCSSGTLRCPVAFENRLELFT